MEPPPVTPDLLRAEDAEHLKLLSVFHYVMAGLAAVGGCLLMIYFVVAAYMVSGVLSSMPAGPGAPAPPAAAGWFVGAVGVFFCVGIWGIAAAYFLCGRWLAARRNRSFCFVVACLSCINFPLGTVLGIFTIVVLQRPGVQWLFDQESPGAYLNR